MQHIDNMLKQIVASAELIEGARVNLSNALTSHAIVLNDVYNTLLVMKQAGEEMEEPYPDPPEEDS